MNHNGAFSEWGGILSPSFEWQNGTLVVLFECLWIAECFLTGPLGAPRVFQSLHSMFKVSFETLLEMWNMNFHWPSLVSFFVYQFTGLKCSLESCPRSLKAPDRHLVFKAQWRHQMWQPREGLIACGIGSTVKFRKEGAGGVTQPISSHLPTPAPSLNSEENKHVYQLNWAVVTEAKMPCSVHCSRWIDNLDIPNLFIFFETIHSWRMILVLLTVQQSSFHSNPLLISSWDKIRESWLCTV